MKWISDALNKANQTRQEDARAVWPDTGAAITVGDLIAGNMMEPLLTNARTSSPAAASDAASVAPVAAADTIPDANAVADASLVVDRQSVAVAVANAVAGPVAPIALVAPVVSVVAAAPVVELASVAPVAAVMPVVSAPQEYVERRKQRRVQMKLTARVRPANPSEGLEKEVATTANASKAGIYFLTASTHYYQGMQLYIAFPYCSSDNLHAVSENIAEAIRVDVLPNGQLGIAVAFRPRINRVQTNVVVNANTPVQERRNAPRFHSSFTAAVTELQSDTRLNVRCSDVSLHGIYVDTLNPFPEGTAVLLRVQNAEREFEATADVRWSQFGMGMGLSLGKLSGDQLALLADWVNERAAAITHRGKRPGAAGW